MAMWVTSRSCPVRRTTGPDHLDRAALALAEAEPFGDPDRLAVRVGVPRGACAGRDVDARRPDPRVRPRRCDRVDVHRSREQYDSRSRTYKQCERNDPNADLAFGNGFTYNSPAAAEHGRQRFGRNEGAHGVLATRFRIGTTKQRWRTKTRARATGTRHVARRSRFVHPHARRLPATRPGASWRP